MFPVNDIIFIIGIFIIGSLGAPTNVQEYEEVGIPFQADDVNFPSAPVNISRTAALDANFKFKWVAMDGSIFDENNGVDIRIEVAATTSVSQNAHMIGSRIIANMLRYAPESYFEELANNGRVGLFIRTEGSTVYPEYEHLRDRPECEGTCEFDCSNTCTSDGRKYDSLAGLGGRRATCLDDNIMCNSNDPYRSTFNVLSHEFAHTYHQYALPVDVQTEISLAYQNALALGIWDTGSYAMSNELEYFAEASTVFFNTNIHGSSTGGMNSCGRLSGFCQNEAEARDWLNFADNNIYNILVEVYTNNRPELQGELAVCTSS
ncbi:unnamed protein product [Owenia fusiformis]|uniref:Lysine-specific metallo-endopeptidase domain-containing protein n=1 Tax=Owenia fusiformis TaxID=6347 RepID=A0A8S4N3B6_OWEFU|nr:unnamed protein product [Owenia fusiformis]